MWDLVSVKAKLPYCCMFWLERRYKQAWCMHFRPIRTAMLLGSWIARPVIVCLVAEQSAIVRSHAGCRCVMYRTRAAIERHSPNFLPFWGYIYVNQCDIFLFIFPASLSFSFLFLFRLNLHTWNRFVIHYGIKFWTKRSKDIISRYLKKKKYIYFEPLEIRDAVSIKERWWKGTIRYVS